MLSCDKLDERPAHDSIAGDWIFSDPDVTGEFYISGSSGQETVEKKGYFSIDLISYAITEEDTVVYSQSIPGTIQFIQLTSNAYVSSTTKLFLAKGSIKADFTEITFSEIAILRSSPGAGTTVSAALRNIVLKRK